jgi:cell division septum initiation protein DivIVA
MAETFRTVKRGYDPAEVDAFVRGQAEAWRAELSRAVEGLEEWKRRAEEFAGAVGRLEQRMSSEDRRRSEEIHGLQTSLTEMRWARDHARAELAALQARGQSTALEAADLIDGARAEAARLRAVAEAEVQEMYAAARRRIAMAEEHAKERIAMKVLGASQIASEIDAC